MRHKFNNELVELAVKDEERFMKKVKEESMTIPASVRIFLADAIRNALVGLENDHHARVKILDALKVVGI